jgi:drug/metabolite transporter (DMT)-like permease
MLSDSTKGYLCVIAAAVLWGSSGTVGKALFHEGISPFDVVQIRVTFGSLILAGAFVLFARHLFRIRFRDIAHFAVLGGLLLALVQITYFYAISKIQVMAAILIQYLSAVWVALFAMTFWGERPRWYKLVALVAAIGGCYLVVGGYDLQLLQMNRIGTLVGLVSAIAFAAYALFGEKVMQRYSPWTVVFYALAFAAVTWQLIYTPFKCFHDSHDFIQWAGLLYIVVMGTIMPFGLYFVGINYIRSTRATIAATLEPIAAGLMAYFALGEKLEPLQLLGAALVIGAIVLLQIEKERDELTPALIRKNETNA